MSPPTGVIYSQVERENWNLSLLLFFSGRVAGLGEEAEVEGRRVTETKIIIYKTNPDLFPFLLSKVAEVVARTRYDNF